MSAKAQTTNHYLKNERVDKLKKLLSLLLVVGLVMSLMVGMAFAEEIEECPAAPDVAGQILEGFDVGFRYEAGTVTHRNGTERIVYENYIAMVAHQMTNGAQFPVYDWFGQWDGESYVDKCDEEAYYQAIYNYLVGLGANIPKALTVELLEDIADSFLFQPIKSVDGNYPTVKVIDIHGNPVEGVGVRASFPTIAEIATPILTNSDGIAVFDHIFYNLHHKGYPILGGTYQINFYLANALIRTWSGGSRALSNRFQLYDMLDTWVMSSGQKVVIETHTIDGFSGKLTSATGTIQGNIEGELGFNGDVSIRMDYDREGIATDGYFAIFTGTMTDFNNASGIRVHGNNEVLRSGDGQPTAWSMTRQ